MFGPARAARRRAAAPARRARRRVHRQIAHAIEVARARRIELHDQVERGAAVEDAPDGGAGEAGFDRLGHVAGAAVARDRRPVEHEPDERHVHLLLERQIGHAGTPPSLRGRVRRAAAACADRRRTP
jgi:hypothetical protein